MQKCKRPHIWWNDAPGVRLSICCARNTSLHSQSAVPVCIIWMNVTCYLTWLLTTILNWPKHWWGSDRKVIHFADYSSYRLAWKAEQKINDLPKSISYLLTSRLRNTAKHGKALHHWVFFSWCSREIDCLFIEILIGEHLLGMSIKTALSSQKTDRCCWPFNITALSLWVFVMNCIESMYLLDEAV